MIQMNLHQVAAIVGGSLVGKEARIQGVATDSRDDCQGKLFVALCGEHFDGHQFCQQAVDQGAAAVLVSQAVEVDVPQVICQDSLQALQALATAWVKQCDIKVIGITGSNGKTTVKNMLYAVLSQKFRCMATQGNLNNEIGVPLTVLSISKDDQVAVIEMGAAQIGDIALLSEIAQPQMAIVTNASQAHVGRFGSEANIAIGKGEIYLNLEANNHAFINADSPYALQWKQGLKAQIVTFGESIDADVRLIKKSHVYAIKINQSEPFAISLPVLGHHNYLNATAVTAIAHQMGMNEQEIAKGLAEFKPEKGRLNSHQVSEGLLVIDDSYNANPASMKAAIDVLVDQQGPCLLIAGDMAELGDDSARMHSEVGEYASQKGVDQVWAVGNFANDVCANNGSSCEAFADVSTLLQRVESTEANSGTILVKGSRSMHLEQVVEKLVGESK